MKMFMIGCLLAVATLFWAPAPKAEAGILVAVGRVVVAPVRVAARAVARVARPRRTVVKTKTVVRRG